MDNRELNIDNSLLNLLNKLLSSTGEVNDKHGNYGFHCPYCHHHNKKLIVQLDINNINYSKWHCWVCNQGKNKSLFKLFVENNATQNQLEELKSILTLNNKQFISNKLFNPDNNNNEENFNIFTNKSSNIFDKCNVTPTKIQLPLEFIPLSNPSNSPEYKASLNYILNIRKLKYENIIQYNIGYGETGIYRNKIILPSYDSKYNLNYYICKDIYSGKYINPKINKNIIIYDSFINWQLPIIIVEGMFDAISTKFNTIPLLGKYILSNLMQKIIIKKPKVYLCLDQDAQSTTDNLLYILNKNGIYATQIPLPEGQDPNSLGEVQMFNILKEFGVFKNIPITIQEKQQNILVNEKNNYDIFRNKIFDNLSKKI